MNRLWMWPAFAGALGVLLSAVGFPFFTWQYWAIFLLALAWVICERTFGEPSNA